MALDVSSLVEDEDVGNAVAALDLDLVTRAFVNLRDARAKLSEEFKAKDGDLKEKQNRLQGVLLRHLQIHNQNSASTASGTVYRQEDTTPTAADWDAFYTWIKENDAFDALERRIKKNFIKDYMDTHDGGLPPGVSVFREFVVRVRRA